MVRLMLRCGAVVGLSFSLLLAPACAQDDLGSLSTEFDAPADLTAVQRVHQVEHSSADHLARGQVENGWLVLEPHTSTWYQDYRGVLVFKPVTGDFVVTTHLIASGRNGGAPRSNYSLGGIMIRTPRTVTPQTWQRGRENYIFLSLGAADRPGQFQFEVKTTINSNSQLRTAPASGGDGLVRIARIGQDIVCLRQQGGQWQIHERYRRSDFPDTLQVGLCVYTDYNSAHRLPAAQHNQTVIHDGNPDLIARFEYLRFQRPQVPAPLVGHDLSRATDDALLSFLGQAADTPGSAATPMPQPQPQPDATPPAGDDDLVALSDDFDSAATMPQWLSINNVERSSAQQIAHADIGETRAGWLTLVPHAVVWYQDWRGPLVFKAVRGDYMATTHLHVTGRDGRSAPRSQFSLGGILSRAPRQVTPQTWRPGQENYLFLSLGVTQQVGQYTWEVKTTVNSDSQLQIEPAGGDEGYIRVVRVGSHFIMMKRAADGPWTIHRRYQRADLPDELQVGMTVYTDWPFASRTPPAQHNFTALSGGNPDLIAQFDYVHYRRPPVPESLAGKALSNPQAVSDAELLAAFGAE